MKQVYYRTTTLLALAVLLICLLRNPAYSQPVTSSQAQLIVRNWLNKNPMPMNIPSKQATSNITGYYDSNNLPAYYVVKLQPSGFVIVSGDDEIEPIIAVTQDGVYDPSTTNPLGALVNRDMSERISRCDIKSVRRSSMLTVKTIRNG